MGRCKSCLGEDALKDTGAIPNPATRISAGVSADASARIAAPVLVSPAMDLFSRRTAGLLLHPTSLPGPHGNGDIGDEAHRFVEFLSKAGLSTWQMLPVTPPGRSSSPYDSTSAFAGSAVLVSLLQLAEEGLLTREDVDEPVPHPRSHAGRVDLRIAAAHRLTRLRRAFERARAKRAWRERMAAFREREAAWLDDHTLFAALREIHRGRSWIRWDAALRQRSRSALAEARANHADKVAFHLFVQTAFDAQWRDLRLHAGRRGVALIGDVPIYVALESADVWAHPELFDLGRDQRPVTVAGVPPDYFNRNGQLWGNPTYRWERHAEERFAWWIARLERTLALFDNVRLDHFIGFHRGWAVPANARTARRGQWRPGPGGALFRAVEKRLGPVRWIAEDLGLVTPEVTALRDTFHFRGMRLLQFAFDGSSENVNLPHNLPKECVVYTGTHDNKTTREWYDQRGVDAERRSVREIRAQRDIALRYLDSDGREFHWDLIRAAFASVADTVILPVQDVLGLGAEARMNRPGTARGNWNWKLAEGALPDSHAERLAALAALFGRR